MTLLIDNFAGININAYIIVDGDDFRTVTTRTPISYDGVASLCCNEGHKIHANDFITAIEMVECKYCLKKYKFNDLKFIKKKMTTTDIIVKELSDNLHSEGFNYTKPCLLEWVIGERISVNIFFMMFTISMDGVEKTAYSVDGAMKLIKQFMWRLPVRQRIQSLLKF